MDHIFKFICCGNVDDGKSTLIGRILLDTNSVKKDQLEDAKKASRKNGADKIEFAMLLDGLLSEREQQITIDIAHRYFDYHNVRFHILDCPGHKQYTKNMAIAAAEADSAIVVIDITKGISEQTEKHIQICSLFNIKNICVCLTKCDLISDKNNEPDKKHIQKSENEIKELMAKYPFNYAIIPVSAVTGYNVDNVLAKICEYAKISNTAKTNIKERVLHIQAAKLYKGKRYYYAREVNALPVEAGDTYILHPNNIPITITKTISHGCFQIAENVDISAGDCITNCPAIVSNRISHQTVWFEPPSENMLFKHGARIVHVVHVTDSLLELDSPLIYHNLDDLKQNGFGIFIDAVTKKTLGCSVFGGNKIDRKNKKDVAKIYVIPAEKTETAELHIRSFTKSCNIPPVILDIEELKKNVTSDMKAIRALAKILQRQGHNVTILLSKTDDNALFETENSEFISIGDNA